MVPLRNLRVHLLCGLLYAQQLRGNHHDLFSDSGSLRYLDPNQLPESESDVVLHLVFECFHRCSDRPVADSDGIASSHTTSPESCTFRRLLYGPLRLRCFCSSHDYPQSTRHFGRPLLGNGKILHLDIHRIRSCHNLREYPNPQTLLQQIRPLPPFQQTCHLPLLSHSRVALYQILILTRICEGFCCSGWQYTNAGHQWQRGQNRTELGTKNAGGCGRGHNDKGVL